jgi:hypothetical protein
LARFVDLVASHPRHDVSRAFLKERRNPVLSASSKKMGCVSLSHYL